MEGFGVKDGVDHLSVEGVADTLYRIPTMAVQVSDFITPIKALWWRAVGHTHTAFAVESLLDEVAIETQQDPVALRLSLLNTTDPKQARFANLLQHTLKSANWKENDQRGFAAHFSFNTWVAVVADVTVEANKVKVNQLHMTVDCGVAINPTIIAAQMKGGAGYALSAMAYSEVDLTQGVVTQSNFTDYPVLRMPQMPAIEVSIVRSNEAPTGDGEPGVPPTAPAIANAIRRAGGKRITELPMTKQGLSLA